jgi:hypothetical protein
MTDHLPAADEKADEAPINPWQAFAFFVSKCSEGFGQELMCEGKTETQARNAVIGCLLDFAAGEACRIARREGREPSHERWTKAVNDAFERAVRRTESAQQGESA